jgi:hypothetical protein
MKISPSRRQLRGMLLFAGAGLIFALGVLYTASARWNIELADRDGGHWLYVTNGRLEWQSAAGARHFPRGLR